MPDDSTPRHIPPRVHWQAESRAAWTMVETFLETFTNEARCNACGDEIFWLRTELPRRGGRPAMLKNVPLNQDLSRHACPLWAERYSHEHPPEGDAPLPEARTLSTDELKERRERQKKLARRNRGGF